MRKIVAAGAGCPKPKSKSPRVLRPRIRHVGPPPCHPPSRLRPAPISAHRLATFAAPNHIPPPATPPLAATV
jgi:hypothetical protein